MHDCRRVSGIVFFGAAVGGDEVRFAANGFFIQLGDGTLAPMEIDNFGKPVHMWDSVFIQSSYDVPP